MKKNITLLLTLALALSVCAMPAAAAVDTTAIKANFDVDSLEGVEHGKDLCTLLTSKWSKYYFGQGNHPYFMQVIPSNINLTVEESDGNKVVAVEQTSTTKNANVEFTFLPSFSPSTGSWNVDQDILPCRTSDVAFSFKVKLSDYAKMYIYTSGQNSSDTEATTNQDDKTLLAYTKNNVNTNVRVLNNAETASSTTSYDSVIEDTNTFLRNEWTEFKIIYNYESGNSTFDVYVNDRLIAENQKLHYPNFLLNFSVVIWLYPNTIAPKAYIDDIQLYTVADNDTKVQPNAAKSGNGTVTVAKADTVATKDEEITYTITPDNGSYISSVTYGGTAIPAFDASGVTYKENADGKKLSVIFRDYEDSAPALMVSPFKFKVDDSTYLFMKLLKNGLDVPEYGMVISTTVEEPTAENARVVPFTNTLHQFGYYGYEVVNNSDVADQSFYVRPYAKVGDDFIYGNVQLVEPANILN